ncbi:MAG: hypothetical protein U0U70_00930 [Chitinophagaceae bacterium]
MIYFNRDILLPEKGVVTEQELQSLHALLKKTESPEQFCIAHELVNRNRITSDPKKILREARLISPRPFRFFINKN